MYEYMNWQLPMLRKFKKAYQAAAGSNQEQFRFEGHPYMTSFAKYLIEYLSTRLGVK